MSIELLLAAEFQSAGSEIEAARELDRFREAVLPSGQYRLTPYRASYRDLERDDQGDDEDRKVGPFLTARFRELCHHPGVFIAWDDAADRFGRSTGRIRRGEKVASFTTNTARSAAGTGIYYFSDACGFHSFTQMAQSRLPDAAEKGGVR